MAAQRYSVAVLGLGMIGGSLALALKASDFADRVLAWDRDPQALAAGLDAGVIDAACDGLDAALTADIAVVAVPNVAAASLLRDLLARTAHAHDGPVLTDVASVKGNLAAVATAGGAAPRYVPGHPIAGSERSGVAAANPDLFARHRVILTPLPAQDAAALALVTRLWESVGADVVCMDVAEHDAVLAATSHLPHVLAYCLVDDLAASPRREDLFRFAAGGFRDFTRIASSDPVMWRDVALANREALVEAVDEFSARLTVLREAIAAGDGARLEAIFGAAKAARDAFAEQNAVAQDKTVVERAAVSGHEDRRRQP